MPYGSYPTPLTYQVRYRRLYSSRSSTYNTSGRHYTIHNLSPGTTYDVAVLAVSSIGSGSTVSRDATTYQRKWISVMILVYYEIACTVLSPCSNA